MEYEKRLHDEVDAKVILAGLAPDIRERFLAVQNEYQRARPVTEARNEALHEQGSSAWKLALKFLRDVRLRPERYFGSQGYLRRGFPTYLKQRNRTIEDSRFGIVHYSLNRLTSNRYKKRLQAYYQARSQAPDLSEPYVYLPLHYQPEMTTSPNGGVFVDQFLCVETLVRNIPPEWKIYVKEHLTQFNAFGEGHTGRSSQFYDDLLRFPNVRLVQMECDSFTLIEHALAVATVSGTVGWEAMARRKPVLVFGLAWYESYPGALKVNSDGAASQITPFIRGFSYDEAKLLAYLAALQNHSLHSYCLTGPKEKNDQPEEEYIGNMVRFIRARAGGA
jgi:hypothetical protein